MDMDAERQITSKIQQMEDKIDKIYELLTGEGLNKDMGVLGRIRDLEVRYKNIESRIYFMTGAGTVIGSLIGFFLGLLTKNWK